jgi:hypothetical protein
VDPMPRLTEGSNGSPAADDPPSVQDLVPDEPGGEEARRGFVFQDHVAAGFYLEMAEDGSLTTVWCEADDDVTLVWEVPQGEGAGDAVSGSDPCLLAAASCEVEFVQVKGNEYDQLWSPSLLCRLTSRNGRQQAASSILEKSLSRDRYREPSRFRLVTIRPVHSVLALLEFPFDHALRQPSSREYQALEAEIPDRVKTHRSPKGHTWAYWVARTRWDVRHSEEAVRNQNLLRLERVLRARRGFLAPDQREVIYERLVRRAFEAAVARRHRDPHRKRMRRDELLALLRQLVEEALRAGVSDEIPPLERKLGSAQLSPETVGHAKEARRRYLRARRTSPYYAGPSRAQAERVEAEVGSRLHMLWARFEGGAIDESPAAFHARCLEELVAIRAECSPEDAPTLVLLQGMMYDRVQRCLLRFDRVAV